MSESDVDGHAAGEPAEFRGSVWGSVKIAVAFLLCLASSVGILVVFYDRASELPSKVLIVSMALFALMAASTAGLGYVIYNRSSTRIVLDNVGVTHHAQGRSETLCWTKVVKVELISIGGSRIYTLHGINGTAIPLSDDLKDFEELRRRLAEHVELPDA